jgi:hypothetical protein
MAALIPISDDYPNTDHLNLNHNDQIYNITCVSLLLNMISYIYIKNSVGRIIPIINYKGNLFDRNHQVFHIKDYYYDFDQLTDKLNNDDKLILIFHSLQKKIEIERIESEYDIKVFD